MKEPVGLERTGLQRRQTMRGFKYFGPYLSHGISVMRGKITVLEDVCAGSKQTKRAFRSFWANRQLVQPLTRAHPIGKHCRPTNPLRLLQHVTRSQYGSPEENDASQKKHTRGKRATQCVDAVSTRFSIDIPPQSIIQCMGRKDAIALLIGQHLRDH